MKLILIIFVFSVVYFQQLHRHSTNGQYLEEPQLTFQPFAFDLAHRGSFNISYCIKEVLNCYELLKPGIVCKWTSHHASLCDTMNQQCDDEQGDFDGYNYRFNLYESVCTTDNPTFTRLRSSNRSAEVGRGRDPPSNEAHIVQQQYS